MLSLCSIKSLSATAWLSILSVNSSEKTSKNFLRTSSMVVTYRYWGNIGIYFLNLIVTGFSPAEYSPAKFRVSQRLRALSAKSRASVSCRIDPSSG